MTGIEDKRSEKGERTTNTGSKTGKSVNGLRIAKLNREIPNRKLTP